MRQLIPAVIGQGHAEIQPLRVARSYLEFGLCNELKRKPQRQNANIPLLRSHWWRQIIGAAVTAEKCGVSMAGVSREHGSRKCTDFHSRVKRLTCWAHQCVPSSSCRPGRSIRPR